MKIIFKVFLDEQSLNQIFILTGMKLLRVSKCHLCFSRTSTHSLDEYLTVRILNDDVSCMRAESFQRIERNEKTARKRAHGRGRILSSAARNSDAVRGRRCRRNSRGKSVAPEATEKSTSKDLPCWRAVGLTARARPWWKSSDKPLCRVLLRYNWKRKEKNVYIFLKHPVKFYIII